MGVKPFGVAENVRAAQSPELRGNVELLYSKAVAFDDRVQLFFQLWRCRHHRQTMFVRRNEAHELHHAFDRNGARVEMRR